jgi:NADH-quinone oxidoreductase subunit D
MADTEPTAARQDDIRTEEMVLNMGPQHPSTHGVLRVMIRTDGEIILDCEPMIGYLHRCYEKIAENVSYVQNVCYTDRMDYVMAMGNNLGFCLAVEKLLGIEEEIPERAQIIRTIVVELDRIASHLVAVGTYGLDVGAGTPFFWCFRDREEILRIFEEICGQRLNYNYVRPGGVAYDMQDYLPGKILDFLDVFEPHVDEIDGLLSYNGIFIQRTANVGILPLETALSYGITGPSLRASGLRRDLRKKPGYMLYDRFDFDVPVGTGVQGTVGDCWDRYWVRVQEMRESTKIVRQAIEQLPEGDFMSPKVKSVIRPPKGDAYHAVENARGELGFYVISDGSANPYRVKTRAPSFCNISVLPAISKGCMVADMVAIIGSLDIVLGEIDR